MKTYRKIKNVKMSKRMKKLWKNKEYRKSFSLSHKGQQTGHKWKKGCIPWNKNKTKKTDARLTKASLHQKGIKHKKRQVKYPKKSAEMRRRWNDLEYRTKMLKIHASKEYREKSIKAILKGLCKRPTSFEKLIIFLCEKYSLPFKYVGNGVIIINFINPDFICTNGKKLLIEVYNSFFKIRDFGSCKNYENERYEKFLKFGYKTLFLNEDSLYCNNWEKVCTNKIRNFLKYR